MNAIIGFTGIAMKNNPSDEVKNCLENSIAKSGFPSTLFSHYGTARLQAIRSRAVLRFWGRKRGFFAKKAVLLGGSRV